MSADDILKRRIEGLEPVAGERREYISGQLARYGLDYDGERLSAVAAIIADLARQEATQ